MRVRWRLEGEGNPSTIMHTGRAYKVLKRHKRTDTLIQLRKIELLENM